MNYHRNQVQRETNFPSTKTVDNKRAVNGTGFSYKDNSMVQSPKNPDYNKYPQGSNAGPWFQSSAPFTSVSPNGAHVPTSATPNSIPQVQKLGGVFRKV